MVGVRQTLACRFDAGASVGFADSPFWLEAMLERPCVHTRVTTGVESIRTPSGSKSMALAVMTVTLK